MLTAVILAHGKPAAPLRRDAIARSLASLVESCVQGLVADAVLVGAPERGLEAIADEAGCALVETATAEEGLARGLDAARRDRILLLCAGNAVERGFIDEIDDVFVHGAPDTVLVLRLAPHSLLTRLAPRLSEPVGVIAPKSALRAAASADLGRLARKLGCAELSCRARRTY
ncbi:transposase [Methylocystis sp. IM3]|uniref:transposase n=1 Tax=unclassified Methylocystis TaxID=2625913 RepID=UPI000FA168AF|nr:MAG: transposase [Hyphomicrobiales bacterium]